jgi:hypothetical protein
MMQPMAQQLLPGQPPQMMMPGGFHGQMQPPPQQMQPPQQQMQPPQHQFMQSLGQISQPGHAAMSVQMQQQQQLQQQQLQQQQQQQQLLQQYLRQYQQVPGATIQQQMLPQLNQVGMMPNPQLALTNSILLGQPTPGSQAVNAQSFGMQNQSLGQPPLDIFHLADKAAQALSGQQYPQANAPVSMSNPNFPPMPAQSASTGQSFQQHQQKQNLTSEADLPRMVQYAVQVSTADNFCFEKCCTILFFVYRTLDLQGSLYKSLLYYTL